MFMTCIDVGGVSSDFEGFDFDVEFQRWSCPNALKRAAPKEAVVVVN